MSLFKNHFSHDSAIYRRYRPTYPEELFLFCSSLVPAASTVWDCGTGNGQAAAGLALRFRQVIATDASVSQLSYVPPNRKVSCLVSAAERSPLKSSSVQLVTVAQALHWFRFEEFFQEVRRVLSKEGRFICWTYGWMSITPEIDRTLNRFRTEVVGPFWPPESRHVTDEYKSIPFPLKEEPAPRMAMEMEWTLKQVTGYLNSWSATAAYIRKLRRNPIDEISETISDMWGEPGFRRRVRWPLIIRVGKP